MKTEDILQIISLGTIWARGNQFSNIKNGVTVQTVKIILQKISYPDVLKITLTAFVYTL